MLQHLLRLLLRLLRRHRPQVQRDHGVLRVLLILAGQLQLRIVHAQPLLHTTAKAISCQTIAI